MAQTVRKCCIFVIIAVTLSVLPGCGESENNITQGNRDKVLHWGNGEEPQELDPHIVTGISGRHVIIALLEGLVHKDPDTLVPIPAVAKSWSIREKNKVYTFHLRENARWSNGDHVSSYDFVWSWKRALIPALGNQFAYMFFPIKNAEAFYKGQIRNFSDVGIKAPNPLTLEITLENPTPYFLQLLDHYSMYPVHRSTIEKFGAPDDRGTLWTRAGNFVGNGAFTLKQWDINKVIIVEKNPQYWDADSVELNKIYFYPTQNITTEERMFRAGQLHRTYDVPFNKIAVYKRDNPHLLRITPYLGTYFYRVNTRLKHLSDVRVRRALSLAINRDLLVENVTGAGERAAYSITPPGTMGYYADVPQPTYDPERARELLVQAGYVDGQGLPMMEILYNTSEAHRKIAVAIQQMWKKELNVTVSLLNQDWKVFLDSESSGNYQISRGSWIGDYVDPNSFLDMWLKDSGNNRTGWHNTEYDHLILDVAPAAKTREERYKALRKAEMLLLNDVPVIPIYTYVNKKLVHPSVKGLSDNLMNWPLYKRISLRKITSEFK